MNHHPSSSLGLSGGPEELLNVLVKGVDAVPLDEGDFELPHLAQVGAER